MRVLQLIDSLHPGGAERMAVTLANALHTKIEGSYICVTREEGALKKELDVSIPYIFLEKKGKVAINALRRLRAFCIDNDITHVHAHGTSFFIATQLKMVLPKIKLVWHEHYGSRITSTGNQHKVLRFCSGYFDQIIAVTPELKTWSEQHLKCSDVMYIPNFVDVSVYNSVNQRNNSIICVANLKQPKNHLYLLKAFALLLEEFPKWELVLVGKIFNDTYYKMLKDFVAANGLIEKVSFLGDKSDVKKELLSSKIGVLSSSYEGLPLALLEYGAAGLVPVTTDVGFCKDVISTFGKVAPLDDETSFKNLLKAYMLDDDKRQDDAKRFKNHVLNKYSVAAVIPQFIELYKNN
jgi:glycosyltransferase involved in cell wall biosynthesis